MAVSQFACLVDHVYKTLCGYLFIKISKFSSWNPTLELCTIMKLTSQVPSVARLEMNLSYTSFLSYKIEWFNKPTF